MCDVVEMATKWYIFPCLPEGSWVHLGTSERRSATPAERIPAASALSQQAALHLRHHASEDSTLAVGGPVPRNHGTHERVWAQREGETLPKVETRIMEHGKGEVTLNLILEHQFYLSILLRSGHCVMKTYLLRKKINKFKSNYRGYIRFALNSEGTIGSMFYICSRALVSFYGNTLTDWLYKCLLRLLEI